MKIADLFFSFKGRIGRRIFWLAYLLPAGIWLLAEKIDADPMSDALDPLAKTGEGAPLTLATAAAVGAALLLLLLACWMIAALNAKRLHDLGKSGWWQLIGFAGTPLAIIAVLFSKGAADYFVIALMIFAFSIWALWIAIHVMFFPGTDGPNDYGSPTEFNLLIGGAPDTAIAAGSAANVSATERRAAPSVAPPQGQSNERRRPHGFGRRVAT